MLTKRRARFCAFLQCCLLLWVFLATFGRAGLTWYSAVTLGILGAGFATLSALWMAFLVEPTSEDAARIAEGTPPPSSSSTPPPASSPRR